jgi:divalent metal cation (Fe/Co/Zn/Cd) transporter
VHDEGLEQMAPGQLRAGVRVSRVSIAWTLASSALAIALGLAASSVVLVAFGGAGLLDAAGSTVLVVHFRHALRHEAFSARHERMALRVVTIGLVVVGGLTAAESARRLAEGADPEAVPVGVAVSGASMVVLGWLAVGKQRIAGRIPSQALRADGWLSATGCLLAGITVAGTGLNAALGWWWADAAAASGVAVGAVMIGVHLARAG